MATNDATRSAAGAAPHNQLDLDVAHAIASALYTTVELSGVRDRAEVNRRLAVAAVNMVCDHLRAASPHHGLPFDALDPRLSSAIDDYLSGAPAPSGIPASTLAQMAAVPVRIVDAEEPPRGSAG